MSARHGTRAAPLLRARGLEVRFPTPGGELRAVDDVDLELYSGDTLALVGESGCGKSTLARALLGLVPVRAGSVCFRGDELVGLPRRALRARRAPIQMIFQDPDASLDPRMSVAALVGEPLVVQRRARGAALDERVCALLERVGLDPGSRRRYPHAFSGGQRQRIAIARALATEPQVLLCDEVSSALDVSIQAQILNLLADLQRELSVAMLFITHDLGVVRHVADRVAVMYLGQIVEQRSTAALFSSPSHPYSEALLAAVPRFEAEAAGVRAPLRGEIPSPLRPPSGCRFRTRCPEAMPRCRQQPPELYEVEDGQSRCLLRGG